MRRFSIRSLMAFILVSAVGLAALRLAGDLWSGMLLVVTLAAVGVAVLGAVILRDRERYWWAGFAFFCGAYLSLAFGPWLSDTFQSQLGTTYLLAEFYSRMHPSAVQGNQSLELLKLGREEMVAQLAQLRRLVRNGDDPSVRNAQKSLAVLDHQIAVFKQIPTEDQFHRAGHTLLALLSGLLGGTVATWFYTRRESRKSAIPSSPQRGADE